MNRVIAMLLVTAAPSLAAAEGFTVSDLGSVASETGCVDRAENMMRQYGQQASIGQVTRGNWSVMAFNLSSQDYEAVVSCNYGPRDQTRATMVVYSSNSGNEEERTRIVQQLKNIWGN
ncbi:MAG: hypothetical protein AAF409_21380 [Pseudomonadota bacterium]